MRGLPTGEVFERLEQPRGEVIYYIKANGTKYLGALPGRATPTFANIPAMIKLVKGCDLADVPEHHHDHRSLHQLHGTLRWRTPSTCRWWGARCATSCRGPRRAATRARRARTSRAPAAPRVRPRHLRLLRAVRRRCPTVALTCSREERFFAIEQLRCIACGVCIDLSQQGQPPDVGGCAPRPPAHGRGPGRPAPRAPGMAPASPRTAVPPSRAMRRPAARPRPPSRQGSAPGPPITGGARTWPARSRTTASGAGTASPSARTGPVSKAGDVYVVDPEMCGDCVATGGCVGVEICPTEAIVASTRWPGRLTFARPRGARGAGRRRAARSAAWSR